MVAIVIVYHSSYLSDRCHQYGAAMRATSVGVACC